MFLISGYEVIRPTLLVFTVIVCLVVQLQLISQFKTLAIKFCSIISDTKVVAGNLLVLSNSEILGDQLIIITYYYESSCRILMLA